MGITLLCSLGFWQLSRAEQKKEWAQQKQVSLQQAPISSQALLSLDQPLPTSHRYAPLRLKGMFMNAYPILLDNKIYKGKAGYEVYLPFLLDNNTVILVNRGWIPPAAHRSQLPMIEETISGEVTIEGYADFAYGNRFISSALEIESISWPLRMQRLDNTLLSTLIGKAVYPMLVVLSPSSPYAFAVSTPQQSSGIPPERHQGYAFQWFGLAITLCVFYVLYLKRIL